ncbi:MAG: hypothetical protein QM774_08500 [Gordonia sp. (in: high G+C Gram-positive bacteria)]|uniref:hypothetical protein n=1 Tax=Gordonia sp. (in: high G+C Gram-positive bacteria) TaxID=84139 RepID=UPI0039E5DB8C
MSTPYGPGPYPSGPHGPYPPGPHGPHPSGPHAAPAAPYGQQPYGAPPVGRPYGQPAYGQVQPYGGAPGPAPYGQPGPAGAKFTLSDFGPIVAVAVAGLAYLVLQAVSYVLLAVRVADGSSDVLTYVAGAVGVLSVIPPIVVVVKNIDRPDGRGIVTALLWVVAAGAVVQNLDFVLMSSGGYGYATASTYGPSILIGAAIVAAWASGRRGSLWSLVAGILGGLLAWAAAIIGGHILGGAGSAGSKSSFYTQVIFGSIVQSLLTVLFLSAAAWAAVGLDRAVKSVFRTLPEPPSGMWTFVEPAGRQGIVWLAVTVIVAVLRIGFFAASGDHRIHEVGAWGGGVLTVLLVGAAAIAATKIAASMEQDKTRRGIVAAVYGVAALLAVGGGWGVVASAKNYGDMATWASWCLRGMFAMMAAGLILAIVKVPWGAVLGLLMLAVTPFAPSPAYAPSFSIEHGSRNVAFTILVMAIAVGLGVIVSRATESGLKSGIFGPAQAQPAPGQPPFYGAPGQAPGYPAYGQAPGFPPPGQHAPGRPPTGYPQPGYPQPGHPPAGYPGQAPPPPGGLADPEWNS